VARIRIGALALASALSFAVSASAQAPAPASPDGVKTVEEVVVTAPRPEAVHSFVQAVTAETSNRRLARWNRTVCPGVLGLKSSYAQHVNDQIAAVAMHVGLKVGEPGCKPNILVIVAKDGQAFTADLAKREKDLFDVSGLGAGSRGRAALEDFLATPRPVRWWHLSETVNEDGQAVGGRGGDARGGGISGGMEGDQGPSAPKVRVRSVSRVKATVRDDFSGVIVIVDAKTANGVSLLALSSYISMVALAQIDPRADAEGIPTILNLFHDRDAGRAMPVGLTDWDVAYLEGTYLARQDRKARLAAERDIEKRMRDALAARQ
jgi:hypothetical protein